MKSKIILLGAVITAFTFTSMAGEALLSPRATDNQIKTATGSVTTPAATVDSTSVRLSPRAGDNELKTSAVADNDANPFFACRSSMSGSPKTVAACSASAAMPGCVKLAQAN